MISPDQSPGPSHDKYTRPKAVRASAKSKQPPSQLYLRDIHDLTLHGGIDAGGDLVMLPVFSGLGTKGVKPGDYLRQAEGFWSDGRLMRILEDVGWKLGKQTLYRARYPALTSALPLPAPAVIDGILSSKDSDATSRDVARSQVSRCAAFPRWRIFRFFGESISDSRGAAEALCSAEENAPGLLTENFRQILDALQGLHTAVDTAEADRRFLVLDGFELGFALKLAYQNRSLAGALSNLANWPAFFKYLQDWNARIRTALVQPKGRLSVVDQRSLLQQLKSETTMWAVLPDVGADAIMEFARSIESAQGQGAIWSEGVSMGSDIASSGLWWEGAMQIARPRSFRLAGAMGLAWRTIVSRAIRRTFYAATEFQLPDLSLAWSNRFVVDSAFTTLIDQTPSRPIAEGGALVVRTDTASTTETPVVDGDGGGSTTQSAFVRIEPAVIKPHVAATRESARLKKFPGISDRYLSWSALDRRRDETFSSAVPSLYRDEREQLLWPHGRLWQAVDMVKTLASQPGLMLCPEVLANGYLRLAAQAWEQLGFKVGALLPDEPRFRGRGPTWRQAYEWFLGASPWPVLPLPSKKRPIYSDATTREWPLTIVDGGLAVADVRLAVRFVPAGDTHKFGDLSSLTRLIKDIVTAARARGESTSSLSDLLSDLGECLRFEARPFFEVDGQQVEESEWFGATKTKAGYYRLACGLAVDSAAYLAKTDQFILRKCVYAKFQNLRLGDIWSVQQQVLAESTVGLSPEEYIRQLSIRIAPVLKELDAQVLDTVAQNLLATQVTDLAPVLRPYQAEGFAWGYLRLHLGFGVCIADEMGLGKTLQAIALLRAMRDGERPSLVVMPKTLLHNWRREIERYGGELRIAIHGEITTDFKLDVLLVTYPRLRVDQEWLARMDWNVVVLDEAQAIKNAGTQLAEAANRLKARHRLALTGTPVENRAAELWSIINWLNPGYLGSQGDFSAYTSLARSSEQKSALLAPLRESLDPLILRRIKADPRVALGLPDKILLDLTCDLSEEQATLYESVIETVLAEDSLGLKALARRAVFLKAILHLKQICIHPDLFYGEQVEDDIIAGIDATTAAATKKIRNLVLHRLRQRTKFLTFENWLARSGKLSAVQELIDSLRLQSRGILIFTQYLGAADILRRAISHATKKIGTDRAHEGVPFIHGGLSSEQRLELVDEFNETCRQHRQEDEPCPILILSLKAGGTGLNLIGADRVVHFDRWWNPAVEDQASDRAHRIGQERAVFVHTVTCQGTIEEAIGRIFVEKRRLAEDLLGAAASEDVGELLRSRDGFLDLVDPQRVFVSRLVSPQQYLS